MKARQSCRAWSWDEVVLNRKGPWVSTGSRWRALLQEGATVLGFVENPMMHFQGLSDHVSNSQAHKETGDRAGSKDTDPLSLCGERARP